MPRINGNGGPSPNSLGDKSRSRARKAACLAHHSRLASGPAGAGGEACGAFGGAITGGSGADSVAGADGVAEVFIDGLSLSFKVAEPGNAGFSGSRRGVIAAGLPLTSGFGLRSTMTA